MKLSTRSRYGLRFLLQLALNYDQGPLQLSEISKRENISEKYLSQIVIILKNSGIISSIRGSQGGYYLPEEPRKNNLKDILNALEGSLCPVDCTDKKDCDRQSICVTRHVWKLLSDNIQKTLEGITLADLVEWHKKQNKNMAYDI